MLINCLASLLLAKTLSLLRLRTVSLWMFPRMLV